ncbi:MAG TPA: glycoside hydrolase family 15 protein [Acidimicrobiales bacterium]|nr:glycoside hydrolase family 15 protein [Acidimicrobiales bacterium]
MHGGGDSLPLRARGLIGDTATAALVAADGTIDWWCPGRFDAPAALFRLLDAGGGAVRVAPAGPPIAGDQSYVERTNVLRTVLNAGEAALEVVDLLPWARGRVDGRIVRIITARRGPVDVTVEVRPGSAFGPARDVTTWSEGIAFDGVAVHTGAPVDGRVARFRLDAGERRVVTIEAVDGRPDPLSVDAALDLLDRTEVAWRSHLEPLTYDGPYRAAVERSFLVLRALTTSYGSVIAAPTTSLPGRIGGERNWDHRYSWVRDAALAVDAAYDAGLPEEAERFVEWLAGVCGREEFPLRAAYRLDGEVLDDADEREVDLDGWRHSQPVRVGARTDGDLQLDFYADVVSAVHTEQVLAGDRRVPAMWPALGGMTDWLSEAWARPDRGIWEFRSAPRQLVFSKLASWYVLDRMARLATARNPLDLSAPLWRVAANDVAGWLDAHGIAADGGLRQDTSSADLVDAALVQVVWRNPWAPDTRVAERTVDRVIQRLGDGPFVYRYGDTTDDGLPPGEGAFLACSFWVVEALARLGRWDEAHARMEELCSFTAPLGLVPEQADPRTRDFLGNLPQAVAHLALVQAALALDDGPG